VMAIAQDGLDKITPYFMQARRQQHLGEGGSNMGQTARSLFAQLGIRDKVAGLHQRLQARMAEYNEERENASSSETTEESELAAQAVRVKGLLVSGLRGLRDRWWREDEIPVEDPDAPAGPLSPNTRRQQLLAAYRGVAEGQVQVPPWASSPPQSEGLGTRRRSHDDLDLTWREMMSRSAPHVRVPDRRIVIESEGDDFLGGASDGGAEHHEDTQLEDLLLESPDSPVCTLASPTGELQDLFDEVQGGPQDGNLVAIADDVQREVPHPSRGDASAELEEMLGY